MDEEAMKNQKNIVDMFGGGGGSSSGGGAKKRKRCDYMQSLALHATAGGKF